MPKIVSIHSFRGGTGKSNTTANVATLLAQQGVSVGVVDTDLQSPGIHTIFSLDQETMGTSLNDYLWGEADIKQTAHDVSSSLEGDIAGRIFLVPASIRANDIGRVMRDGYDVGLLNEGFHRLMRDLSLDILILDTHPGLNEETLLSIAMSDSVAILLRPDQQDYEGTKVTVAVARKLKIPDLFLIVNKVPAVFDVDEVKERMSNAYECEVVAVVPHSDDLMMLSSAGVFSLREPDHPVTELYRRIADRLLA